MLSPDIERVRGRQLESVDQAAKATDKLHEQICLAAYTFETVALFVQVSSLYLNVNALYQTRGFLWRSPMILASIAMLSRHLIVRTRNTPCTHFITCFSSRRHHLQQPPNASDIGHSSESVRKWVPPCAQALVVAATVCATAALIWHCAGIEAPVGFQAERMRAVATASFVAMPFAALVGGSSLQRQWLKPIFGLVRAATSAMPRRWLRRLPPMGRLAGLLIAAVHAVVLAGSITVVAIAYSPNAIIYWLAPTAVSMLIFNGEPMPPLPDLAHFQENYPTATSVNFPYASALTATFSVIASIITPLSKFITPLSKFIWVEPPVIEVLHSASVTSTTALLSSSTANILQNCQSSGPQHHSAGTLKHPLGGMSSRFGKLCIKVALFRAGDGLYLSCVVPFLLQGDRCLHYGGKMGGGSCRKNIEQDFYKLAAL